MHGWRKLKAATTGTRSESPRCSSMRKFDFLLIGAQKSGTTWLWDKLDQHPQTDLPRKKEIHYFGGAELYARGPGWYYEHFAGIDTDRVTGEASTSYFFDRLPYWYNESTEIEYPPNVPPIPELVAAENANAKVLIVLRDPVRRALSAYRHWMKQGQLSPRLGLKRAASELPKMRILEYGHYAQHLAAWRNVFDDSQIEILFFETDVRGDSHLGLKRLYRFLGLDEDFVPRENTLKVHKSWTWTRSAVAYYAGPFRRYVNRGAVGDLLDRTDFLHRFAVTRDDIEFLREKYLPEKEELERVLNRSLDFWDYGAGTLARLR